DQWNYVIGEMQRLAMEESRLNIPILYGIDAIHGTNYTVDATLFPQQVGLAATWNPGLVEEAAAMSAYETRASSIPWTFSPVLDLGIDPRWPRMWEGFGEDPYLQAEMGVAMTMGFQGEDIGADDRIAACLKHYIGYGTPRSGKDRTPAWIPEIMLRELFLPPFQAAVDAGAKTVMVNSGEVNGEPAHASKFLLTDILRGELGFEGVIVTDWYDIVNLVERHHTAGTYKEAVRQSIMAGVDMSMVPYELDFADHLLALVEEGTISEARIDESVRRILQLKVELGLWDRPLSDPADYPNFASEAHRETARQAARESITLLKNQDDILPLPSGAKVLVTGPNANSMRTLNGGWTYTWQGDRTDQFVSDELTIVEALQNTLGEANVRYAEGVRYTPGAQYWADELVDLGAVRRAA
ncbi:MAG TPA: beta-glucosidase, partial [Cytophagales bacterium]|nr:beta-glucosidase [Cytophagales bacterium]